MQYAGKNKGFVLLDVLVLLLLCVILVQFMLMATQTMYYMEEPVIEEMERNARFYFE